MNKTVFVCEDTFDGILSAVYDAYYSRIDEAATGVCVEDFLQNELFAEYVRVRMDPVKAERVQNAVIKKISPDALRTIYCVFLSPEYDKADVIYRFLRLGFKMGRKVVDHLADDRVLRVSKISHRVNAECHRFHGFLRFKEIEGGIYFSQISPENNIIEMLAPHFEDRMPGENWVIYDSRRGRACIHPKMQKFFITDDINDRLFAEAANDTEKEAVYSGLWKTFFTSIAIKERENLRLQIHNMPKKYWLNMTEMN